ncbi:50S ribosomal protein L23 [Candidatus Woesebacteria bacterium]|nr:50S ribosomal protein L23 [Candidatus Woesebacteria bacterium]
MRIIPVLTEKSLDQAKEGNYTFWVDRRLNKNQIRNLVEETFGVHVVRVRTMNVRGEAKRTLRGRKMTIKPRKKAIVILKEKEKIDLFETKKGKK